MSESAEDPYATIEGASESSLREEVDAFATLDVDVATCESQRTRIADASSYVGLDVKECSTGSPIRFSIVRHHASGGLGEVSVARDHELQREVAFKEIQARFADDENNRTRFLLEAEVTARLEHPGIVPVYALGRRADSRPFYAMRFIRGESLKEAIVRFFEDESKSGRSNPSRQRELLRSFIDVCQAIAYAHSRGVIHRDLKPANIMLGKFGETLVVDWGLAKIVGKFDSVASLDESILQPDDDSIKTRQGSLVGTLAYMSPEQASGSCESVGPASDIYSLGATLYHLLTGNPPISEDSIAEALSKIRSGDFPHPRLVKPNVEQPLAAICVKAMQNCPAQRYSSATELANDIELYVADEPTSAMDESKLVKFQRWRRKHPRLVSGIIVSLLLGLIGAATVASVSSLKNKQLAVLVDDLRVANLKANSAKEDAEARRRETIQTLVRMYTARGSQLVDAGDLSASLSWYAKALQTTSENERPAAALRIQTVLDQISNLIAVIPHSARVESCDFSADGRLVCTGASDHTAILFDVERGEVMSTLFHDGPVQEVCFTPDSLSVITASDNVVKLWDASSSRTLQVWKHPDPVKSIRCSSLGDVVFSTTLTGSVFAWDVNTGASIWEKVKIDRGVSSIQATAEIAIVSDADGKTLQVWSIREQQLLGSLQDCDEKLTELVVARNALRAAGIDEKGMVRFWDLGSRKLISKLPAAPGSGVEISDDGTSVVIVQGETWFDPCELVLWTPNHSSDISEVRRFPHPAFVTSVTFDFVRHRMISTATDERVRVWDIERQTIEHQLFHRGYAMSARLDASAYRLVVAGGVGDSGHACIWDLPPEKPHSVFPDIKVKEIAYSPDSKWIAAASEDAEVQIRCADTLNIVAKWKCEYPITKMEFSADSRTLAIGYESQKFALWNWRDATEFAAFPIAGEQINWSQFLNPSQIVLSTIEDDENEPELRVYRSLSSGESLNLAVNKGFWKSVHSRSGKFLSATGKFSTLPVWTSPFRQPPILLKHAYPVYLLLDVDFSPDETMVAVGTREWSGAGGVQLWRN